jgi:hypothetical protein
MQYRIILFISACQKHCDGVSFQGETGGEAYDLEGVAGDGTGSVWAVGSDRAASTKGVILKRMGTTWVKDSTAPILNASANDIFVAGPGDVYVVTGPEIWRRLDSQVM